MKITNIIIVYLLMSLSYIFPQDHPINELELNNTNKKYDSVKQNIVLIEYEYEKNTAPIVGNKNKTNNKNDKNSTTDKSTTTTNNKPTKTGFFSKLFKNKPPVDPKNTNTEDNSKIKQVPYEVIRKRADSLLNIIKQLNNPTFADTTNPNNINNNISKSSDTIKTNNIIKNTNNNVTKSSDTIKTNNIIKNTNNSVTKSNDTTKIKNTTHTIKIDTSSTSINKIVSVPVDTIIYHSFPNPLDTTIRYTEVEILELERMKRYLMYKKEADSIKKSNSHFLNSPYLSSNYDVPVVVEEDDLIEIFLSGGGLAGGINSKDHDKLTIYNNGLIHREYISKQFGKQVFVSKISRTDLVKLAQFIVDMGFFTFCANYECESKDYYCKQRMKYDPAPIPLYFSVKIGARAHKVYVDIFAPIKEKNWVKYPENIAKIIDVIYALAEK